MIHPLFDVPKQVHRGHHGHYYDASEEELRKLLADFAPMHAKCVSLLPGDPELLREYVELALVIWRSYRLAEAEPFLQNAVKYCPEEAALYFYLGQIKEDEVRDFPAALLCYGAFIELEPNLLPENNDTFNIWDLETHPSPNTLEAISSMGTIYLAHFGDVERAKACFRRAIALAPRHHLAPHLLLADLFRDHEGRYTEAWVLYTQSEENYFSIDWGLRTPYRCAGGEGCCSSGLFWDQGNPPGIDTRDTNSTFPKLAAWTARRYPLLWARQRILHFVTQYEQLGIRCHERWGNHDLALQCYARAKQLRKRFQIPMRAEIHLKQIELILEHYRDYWQAEQLCREASRQHESCLRDMDRARVRLAEAKRAIQTL